MSTTRSKLSWLHGLFGDVILITPQFFVFSEKHVICFSYKSHDLHTFVILLPSLDMPYDQHENIIPCVEFNIV